MLFQRPVNNFREIKFTAYDKLFALNCYPVFIEVKSYFLLFLSKFKTDERTH
jgi:hypothetical protein